MANKPERAGTAVPVTQTRLLGSLREALAAAIPGFACEPVPEAA